MNNSNGVRTDTQFSIFLVNKPGVLAKVVQHLAQSKVNIIAMSMMDSTEHGVLRLVAEDPVIARQAISSLELPSTETTVLTTTLPNKPGALADVVERVASEHINVHYAYCTTGAPGGKTLGIFKLSNVNRALQVLAGRKPKRHKEATSIREGRRARS